MRKFKNINQYGYSLFELVVVMIIISIIMTVSMRYMGNSVDIAKTEETKTELNQIADGIIGNENLLSGNHRTDYGYVGDVGALPTSLNNLVTNPGYATWDGPYIHDDFYASSATTETEYLIDGWGTSYSYASNLTISSTGGATTITKELASSTNEILGNTASFNIIDLDYCPPGLDNKDSIQFNLTYPDGSGSYQTDSKFPSAGGFVSFSSLPIGQQTLSVIEMKNNDTLTRLIHINRNSSTHVNIQVPTSIWCDTTSSGGGGGVSSVEILRPMGVGTSSNLSTENCGSGWQCVDEVTSDDDGSFVKGGGSWNTDTYATQNSTVSAGTIDSVIVNIKGRKETGRTAIRTNSTLYEGSIVSMAGSYTDYSTTYITIPNTSSAWTWTEIDALEIGVSINGEGFVTQVWLEVYYTN